MNFKTWKQISTKPSKSNFHFILILFIINFISCQNIYGQVYNYSPMSFDDIEINPSKLATKDIEMIQLIRQDNYSDFSLNSIRYTKYIPSTFMGLGISFNNTNTNQQHYNHLGIGLGYRNIIANKVYIKIGAMYKVIQSNSTSGQFDYYSFVPSDTIRSNHINQKLNVSISLSSTLDRYFLSFSTLNIDLPSKSDVSSEFPSYYVWNVGNLVSLFNKRYSRSEISYSGNYKSYKLSDKTSISHYILLMYGFNLNRKTSLSFGSRIGYAENSYYHLIPQISLITRKFKASLSLNTYFDKNTFHSTFKPSTQINLIYKL